MSMNNRAAHTPNLPAIIAISTILTISAVALACKPSPDRAASPSPRSSARILTNQVGYDASGPKRVVIQAHAGDAFATFAVKSFPGGETVLSGTPVHAGPVAGWKDWDFWTVDWSSVKAEGTYVIECASPAPSSSSSSQPSPPLRSHPLLVQKNALIRNTLSDVVYYFKGQRSSGLWDKADRAMTFEGRPGVVDVRGAWFDASGDYGKHLSHLSYSSFFNPQQISLTAWVLFRALSVLEERDGPAGAEPATKQYRKRLLDEALFGADSLVRLKDPNGSFYITVSGRGPEKKPEDRRITPKAERHIILTPETKDKFRDYGREKITGDAAYEAGYREGAGLCIAALAMAAARSGAPGDPGYGVSRGEGDFSSTAYLKAAEDAFAFLEKNNLLFTNDGKENIVDDYCALRRREARLHGLLARRRRRRRPAVLPPRRRRSAGRRPFGIRGPRGPGRQDEGPGRRRPFPRLRARDNERSHEPVRLQPPARPIQGRGGDAPLGLFLPPRHRDRALVAGRERPPRLDGRGVAPGRTPPERGHGQRLHRPHRRLRPRPARLDPGAQSLRRLYAPRPRPQQHRLHVLRFLGVHERARRHLQRHHG
ncbi:MAG: glycoside hydrolase, partial [Candidatus Aminicenantes bacterium]|nr:glycoside hydrolase [Candidatus Aminicenantes bacterium]